jgi:hypothetical protein
VTRERLLQLMPNASEDFLRRNTDFGQGMSETRNQLKSKMADNSSGECRDNHDQTGANRPKQTKNLFERSLLLKGDSRGNSHSSGCISTDEAKLNKTERARLEYLRRLPHVTFLHTQSVTVKIADNCRLTADYFYFDQKRERFVFEDTKGSFWREDAKIKIKVAARTFPEFTFIVAHKEKNNWREQEINP